MAVGGPAAQKVRSGARMYYRTLKVFFSDKALRELGVLVLFALLLFLSAVEAQLYTRMEEWLGSAAVGWLREG